MARDTRSCPITKIVSIGRYSKVIWLQEKKFSIWCTSRRLTEGDEQGCSIYRTAVYHSLEARSSLHHQVPQMSRTSWLSRWLLSFFFQIIPGLLSRREILQYKSNQYDFSSNNKYYLIKHKSARLINFLIVVKGPSDKCYKWQRRFIAHIFWKIPKDSYISLTDIACFNF